MGIKTYITIGYFVFCSCISWGAQDVSGFARTEKDSIQIGEQLMLEVEAEFPKNYRFDWPILIDSLSREVEIVRADIPDTLVGEGTLKIVQRFFLTSFDSGFHLIPPFEIPFQKEGHFDTLAIRIPPLAVSLAPPDSSIQLYDIRPVYKVSFTMREAFPYLLGLLLFLGLGYILHRYLKHRLKSVKEKTQESRVNLPAHLQAIRDLDALRSEKLWQMGKIKEYYTRLTDIVRIYLNKRFAINSLESTTAEILSELKQSDFEDNLLMNKLEKLLITGDLAKFAKSVPPAEENETNLLDAYLFVNNTADLRVPENRDLSTTNGVV